MIPDINTASLENRVDTYIRDFVFAVKSYLNTSFQLEYTSNGMDMTVSFKDLNRKTKPVPLFSVVYTQQTFNRKLLITRIDSYWVDKIVNKDYKCYFIGEFKKLVSKLSKLHKANNGIIIQSDIFYKMNFISSSTNNKNVLHYAHIFEWDLSPL